MESIIPITGNVKFVITLDPTVWIFDDRKIDLKTYFTTEHVEVDELEEYKKKMGKHWSREIMEGAAFPPTLKTEKVYEKTKMLTGTFGMFITPFVKNAEPHSDAHTIHFQTHDGHEHSFPLANVADFIFKYSDEGKPLKEDGPVHLLLKDGSNIDNPIRNISTIRIE